MKTIGICNGKGGIGKTTTARHLIHAARERQLRVLVVDLDPSGNLSKSLMYQKMIAAPEGRAVNFAVSWDLMGIADVAAEASAHLLYQGTHDVIPMPIVENVSLIGATPELADVLTWPLDAALTARDSLNRLAQAYDLCVIDTPPTLSNLVVGGMICSRYILMPTDLKIDAVSGLLELAIKLEYVQSELNPELEVLGVLLNKVNLRRADDRAMRTALHVEFRDAVLNTELHDRAGFGLTTFHPVWKRQRGESDRRAAKEMRAVCNSVFQKIGL
jgi:chromosome partitioning protein